MNAVTHSTLIGDLFDADHHVVTFESHVALCEVFDSFTVHAHDAVIITEKALHIGILTLKDMMRILQEFENLLRPVGEFMVSPLQTFLSTQSVAEVLHSMGDAAYGKIVVKDEEKVIGLMDHRDLLSLCYTKITPLIKHDYNLVHSMLGLAGEGEKALLKLATTDSLTGIGNRRLFEEMFQAHQALGERYGVQLFLLLFDIDNFKSINDTFGHSVGDSVLKELVTLVGQSIRKSDVFVRWGGEEFAILLRYADPIRVTAVAEQIRQRIDLHSFETIVHITCSFGLSAVRLHESLEEAFQRSDNALYRAKEEGKNAVRLEMV